MSKTGYLISRNRATELFFTKKSSYDRPQWVPIQEASEFPTAELAERAARKLYGYGAYEARIIHISEAIDIEMPDDEQELPQQAGTPADDNQEGNETIEIKMVAQKQGEPEVPDFSVDSPENDDELVGDEDVAAGVADDEQDGMNTKKPLVNPLGGMSESATMPTRPEGDAQPSENKMTVLDVKKPEEIKYKDRATTNADNVSQVVANSDDEKVNVPADVKSALKTVISTFNKAAEFSNTVDDSKASFCMTVASAFEQLATLLDQGTVGSLKAAQIYVASWMNPITMHLPDTVQKFIYTGGRKSSLKNLFDTKWDAKRNEQ